VTVAIGPREQSLRLMLTFVLVWAPRRIHAPRAIDALFVIGMSFQAWGNVFDAFDRISNYDKIVHFALPCGASPLLYMVLVRARLVPDIAHTRGLHQRLGVVLVTVALGLSVGGGLYELYEYFADHALGAHLHFGFSTGIWQEIALYGITAISGAQAGDYRQFIVRLIAVAAGALAGAGLLVAWDAFGWGSAPGRAPRRRR
jgi:hypothetical protein